MTYRDLLNQIQNLSPDQLDHEIILYNFEEDLLIDNEVTLSKAMYDVPGIISKGIPYLAF